MKVNNLKKIIITLGATVLTVLALTFFVIKPLLAQINLQNSEYQKKFSLYERREELRDYLKILEADINVIQEKLPTFQGMLLDAAKSIDFVVRLEEIARETGNWQELSVPGYREKVAEKKRFPSEEFNVELIGSFPNLIRYLVYLENLKWLIAFDSINISRIEKITTKELPADILEGNVQTNLRLKVFTK